MTGPVDREFAGSGDVSELIKEAIRESCKGTITDSPTLEDCKRAAKQLVDSFLTHPYMEEDEGLLRDLLMVHLGCGNVEKFEKKLKEAPQHVVDRIYARTGDTSLFIHYEYARRAGHILDWTVDTRIKNGVNTTTVSFTPIRPITYFQYTFILKDEEKKG